MTTLLFAILASTMITSTDAARAQFEPATERTKLPADWEALRYGMFIHFGMSTFTNNEFGQVPAKSEAFNPTKLDVDQWIAGAKKAGMNYAVLTTKHCYGHALWPTKACDYSVASSSVKVDVVEKFVEACRRHGVKPGFYYLLGWDATNQAKMTPSEYEAFCRTQVTELLSNYGPITEIWFDIPWDMGPDTGRVLADLYALVKKLQPACLVLMNQSNQDGQTVLAEKPTYRGQPAGDCPVALWPRDLIDGERTPPPASGHNPHIPFNGKTYYIPMETCDTLARHWFWVEGDALYTVPTLYAVYRATVGRHANLLLDVAPDKTGRIPAGSLRRLMELKKVVDDPSSLPHNLLEGCKATASNVYRNDPQYGPDKLTDGERDSRWAADDECKSAWVEFDLGKETRFDTAVVSEGWNRVQEFAIEIPDGMDGWKAVYTGGKIGGDLPPIKFRPVIASKVRLHIIRATVGPTIWDFELYGGK